MRDKGDCGGAQDVTLMAITPEPAYASRSRPSFNRRRGLIRSKAIRPPARSDFT